jgi:hypothetical protein
MNKDTPKDFFFSQEECEKAQKTYINTNPRYKNFCQTYFTAGDEEQFETNRKRQDIIQKPIANECQTKFLLDIPFQKYVDINAQAITNTFRYIFHKFKKGIFIQIRDNKVITFLPFSKAKFTNEWSDMIKIDPKFDNITEFMRHINTMENRPFKEKKVNRFPSGWYANNCLVRYEFPLSEGDTGTHHIKNMFEELCANRQVPDIDFFVNRRDFPLLKNDGTEPYNHIWNSQKKELVSHSYDKYAPILSSVSCHNFADIAIPTLEDWARVRAEEGIIFPKTNSRQYNGKFDKPWNERKPLAVFRGGSTGCGVDIETNPRLKVAYLSSLDNFEHLDCGITDWNLRPRKIEGEKYLKTIEIDALPFKLVKKLSPEEQTNYKYIIHIEGHVSAFRLSLELSMGSVLLIVDSQYNLWYKKMLIPYEHYVPVKSDLSDLIEKVKWCKENDEKCKEISENAKKFYEKYLQKQGIFDYLSSLLEKLGKVCGTYEYQELPLEKQMRKEQKWFSDCFEKKREIPVFGLPLMNGYSRDYNKLKAISQFMFEHKLTFKESIQKTKLSTITLCEVSGIEFVVKSSKDDKKMKENIHEAFIGINEINHLLKHIPNFVFTFNALKFEDSVSVIQEKISGVNMLTWLKSDDFNFDDFKLILAQLCLALHVAQKACSFVHYDLYPWNIMIQYIDEVKDIEYVIDKENVIHIRTDIIPIIIDYGKSRVIHNFEHYGFINMFKFNKIHDLITIVFSSFIHVLEKEINNKELLRIINYFTGNNCFEKKITTFSQLKHFVLENSSFTRMISLEKTDMEEKLSLINFFDFLKIDEKYFVVSKRRLERKPVGIVSSKQNFDFTSCATTNNRKYGIKSFPNFEDRIYVYYYFQYLNDKKYIKDFKEMVEKTKIDSSPKEERKSLNLRDDFVDGEKIDIDNFSFENYTNNDIIDMILTYSGIFEVPEEDRKILCKINSNKNREYIADINILKMYYV